MTFAHVKVTISIHHLGYSTLLRRGSDQAARQFLRADLPEAQEHLPHCRGPRRRMGHPYGLADRQRESEGLRMRQREGGGRVLQQGLCARSAEHSLSK